MRNVLPLMVLKIPPKKIEGNRLCMGLWYPERRGGGVDRSTLSADRLLVDDPLFRGAEVRLRM